MQRTGDKLLLLSTVIGLQNELVKFENPAGGSYWGHFLE